MKQPITERVRDWFHARRLRLPLGVVITICVLPAVSVALFYLLRNTRGAMDWVSVYVSNPVRGFLGMLSSIYPLALMEVLCTIAGLFLVYYIIKAIRDSVRRRQKWRVFGKRMLILLVASCYVYSGFCWLWSSGYHATGFAERNGMRQMGVGVEDLASVTAMFAERASELSVQMQRDEEGYLVYSRSEMFAQSRGIYSNISEQFPSLGGTIYTPKAMYLYSWLMSITGYTGMYFALTGEAMINIQPHTVYMPSTVAHEHAHQLGVFAEDEANFVGILACVTSDNLLFQYSGYMLGLNYLSNALAGADPDAHDLIMSGITEEIRFDRMHNWSFWAKAREVDLGIEFLDNFLTTVMETTNEVVDAVYDDYLKSQSHELGIQSYGACVDLLVEYFAPLTEEQ